MKTLNKVTLIGNLGNDPEYKELTGGSKVAKFSLATTESYKKPDGTWQKDTDWHSIIVWGKLAEFCREYLTKGKLVYLEGKLHYRKYTDNTGSEHKVTELVIHEIILLSEKNDTNH